jgi:zinc transporter, ZIP family
MRIILDSSYVAIPLAALTAVATLAGGVAALRLARELSTAIALTGGVVVAVAIFDVLPEAMDAVGEAQQSAVVVGLGFLAFFLAERALVLHHRDDTEHARAHARVGSLGAAGLAAHSFVDGLGIGLAFGVDTATGILVFLAVIAHDFADGLNTVSFVLRQSNDRRQAIRWLGVDAVTPLLGAIVGASLTVSEHALGLLLSAYVGFFLYMGATDLLPHAHEHPSARRVGLTVLGFGAILALSLVSSH